MSTIFQLRRDGATTFLGITSTFWEVNVFMWLGCCLQVHKAFYILKICLLHYKSTLVLMGVSHCTGLSESMFSPLIVIWKL